MSAIVYRFEPYNADDVRGCWSCKVMFDMIRVKPRLQWLQDLGIDDQVLYWCHMNVPQKNEQNYPVRMYAIYFDNPELVSKEACYEIAKVICSEINSAPNNRTICHFQPSSFFWVPYGEAVWSDIIGVDRSLRMLHAKCGTPVPGFYDQNQQAVRCCFRPRSLSLEVARLLYAPVDEIHPDEQRNLHAPAQNGEEINLAAQEDAEAETEADCNNQEAADENAENAAAEGDEEDGEITDPGDE